MKVKTLSLALCLVLSLALIRNAAAHPADMYYHSHAVTLSQEGIQVVWEIRPGALISQNIWFDADADEDDHVSDEEAWAWGEGINRLLTASYQQLTPDGNIADDTPLQLEQTTVDWPSSVATLTSGEKPIRIHFQASWPTDLADAQQVSLQNRFNTKNSISWFQVTSEDDLQFDPPEQQRGRLIVRFYDGKAADIPGLTHWESGSPSVPWVVTSLGLGEMAEDAAAQADTRTGVSSILEGLVKQQEGSVFFILGALAISALLGGLHALSPGHGKTIVAAYLVGSEGRFYHAIVLGLIVTVTHTGSVILLGLVTLAAARRFLAIDLLPYLELASGLLILLLGIGLLYPRLRYWREYRQRQTQIMKPQPTPAQDNTNQSVRLTINQSIEEIGPEHSHDPESFGYIPKGPVQGSPLAGIRWRSLITLGVSGGLVPCPDAIAILLIAVTINRIAFGMSMIVAFSAGLAAILIFIGIVILQGKRLFERLRWFDRVAYIMPVASALIVVTVGVLLSATALRNIDGANPESNAFIQIPAPAFNLAETRIIYTALDPEYRYKLLMMPAQGGTAEQISADDVGVVDFAVSPDGRQVIYSVSDAHQGTQIWTWSPETGTHQALVDCAPAFCSGIVWYPDGRGVLYGRLEANADTNASGITSLWWYDLETQTSAPLFQDSNVPSYNPRWSPDGTWLSYSSVNPLAIQIFHIETGTSQEIPTQTGAPAAWSPTRESLLVVDMETIDGRILSKISHYDLATQQLSLLTAAPDLDERDPVWSPDGAWIAVLRRDWSGETPAAGNQIWLMRPDGSEAAPVTTAEATFHSQPRWSPDGRYLLFEFRVIEASDQEYGIRFLDLETGEVVEITKNGSRPSWLP